MATLRKSVSIVVPTFREASNLTTMAERINSCLSEYGLEWELVFVDDNSGDGSEEIAVRLGQRMPVRMEVRRTPPRDLSLSVLHGIRISRHDLVVVMDADLSHPPECIIELIGALDENCDMVVGSRYITGGGFDRSWSIKSLLNSHLATLLSKPLVSCSDSMSGFFVLDRRVLPNLNMMRPIGYKVALELMVRGQLRVREVPIVFANRDVGYSKMNLRQQINYLRHLGRLYKFKFGSLVRVLCFGMVGLSGFIIDLAFYLAFQFMGVEHRLARLLSFWPAVSWNWWFNRNITFDDRTKQPPMRQWGRFAVASLVGLGVNVGGYVTLTSYIEFFAQYPLVAFMLGILLGGGANFLLSTLYVYRGHLVSKKNTNSSITKRTIC